MAKSGSKEKEKAIQDVLRGFFRAQKLIPCVLPWTKREAFILNLELLHEIGPETVNTNRVKALQSLSETVLAKKLEDNAVESIWKTISDLLEPSTVTENRQSALVFVRFLVQGQYERLGVTRAVIFQFIQKHNVPEDLELNFEILRALTDTGKDLKYFEEKIGPHLCLWMTDLLRSSYTNDLILLLTNLIKFNSSLLDEDSVVFIIKNTCLHICATWSESEILNCIAMLDVCVRYSSLPSKILDVVVCALCRSITYEAFHHPSWQVMSHILGTHLGDKAICVVCDYMQLDELIEDSILLEGSVFVLGHGLWGPAKCSSIINPPLCVVPFLKLALRGKNVLVATEVAVAVKKLINTHGINLSVTVWDIIMDITDEVIEIFKTCNAVNVAYRITEVIVLMEDLLETRDFAGSMMRLYTTIEKWAEFMPESSVFRLLRFRSIGANPHQANWLTTLNQLVERFYKQETRTNVRIKILKILTNAVEDARPNYEEDIVDKIILPLFKSGDLGNNTEVAKAAMDFLIDLARISTSKCCLDILQIIEKVLNKSFDNKREDKYTLSESDIVAIQTAVFGLIELCPFKNHRLPTSHTIRIFQLLVTYLHTCYRAEVLFDTSIIRSKILEFILSLRCNSLCEVGFAQDAESKPKFTKFIVYDSSEHSISPSSSPNTFSPLVASVLPVDVALQALVLCLQNDRDWLVLQLVFNKLPTFLQNRCILLSAEGAVGQLCASVCSIISDRNLGLPDSLTNMPNNFSRSDFHCHALPVLSSLVTYHKQLDGVSQRKFVKCLEFGLVSKCARTCITALTLCTLEMHDTMYKVLPAVLLGLSKISATVGISVAILEFLSSLIRLPRLYASFVEDQYMSIFAIALPYVNPFKFNHNTVALAYHVIAMWFLKCRLPFRRDFVKFIIKGLQSNVLVPLEEGGALSPSPLHSFVDDSNQRRRASTMNEQALATRRRDRPVLVSTSSVPICENRPLLSTDKNSPDRALNVELTETCIDLLARYTFAGFSAIPKRFSASEFLLTGGQSLTWLVGTKLVTVTTSGCSSKVMKHGLCDKCLALCKGEREKSSSSSPSEIVQQSRRRHRSAHQPANKSSEAVAALPRTKDDLQLQRPSSMDIATSGDLGQSLSLRSSEELEAQNFDRLLLSGLQEGASASPLTVPTRPHLCNCWCQGWAEIFVRRPTGNVSWMMRVQNSPHPVVTNADFPLADITTLFFPSREKTPCESYEVVASHRRINSETLEENEYEKIFQEHFDMVTSTDPPVVSSSTFGENIDESGAMSTKQLETSLASIKVSEGIDQIKGSEKPILRRTNSSPDLSSLALSEASRAMRVYSDVAHTSQKARQRVINLLKSTTKGAKSLLMGSSASPQEKEEEEKEKEKEKAIKVTPKEEEVKMTTVEMKPKVTLRRNLSQRDDERRPGSSLSRRGSERSVHFERKSIHSLPPSPSPLIPHSLDSSMGPFRDRGHTISVANPAYRSVDSSVEDKFDKDLYRSGTNPSFVFLQLYHDSCFGSPTERPLLLPKTEVYERALKCFDRIPPYETHKIGVVYIGKGQVNNEAAIFANEWGSMRYTEFLHGLGQLIRLQEVDPQTTYIGGLGRSGEDGKFAYIWQDDVMQVIFHVATLMPNKESDSLCVSKKLHIGNDFVTIVYNDSGEEYNINTIKGQFMYACVVIQPLDRDSNLVVVKAKQNFVDVIGGHSSQKIISNENLPILVRQLALHANLASMIFQSEAIVSGNPYASNWLERLRDLKRLRKKLLEEAKAIDSEDLPSSKSPSKFDYMQDFTDFV